MQILLTFEACKDGVADAFIVDDEDADGFIVDDVADAFIVDDADADGRERAT